MPDSPFFSQNFQCCQSQHSYLTNHLLPYASQSRFQALFQQVHFLNFPILALKFDPLKLI